MVGKDFLKHQKRVIKEKSDKLDFIKLKSSALQNKKENANIY